MKMQFRILNLIDIPWNSGLAAYAFDQAKALKARGHAVYFACPPKSAAWEFSKNEKFPVFPLADTVAMMSLDMVGSGDGTGVDVYGGGEGVNLWLTGLLAGATADAGLGYLVTPAPTSTQPRRRRMPPM